MRQIATEHRDFSDLASLSPQRENRIRVGIAADLQPVEIRSLIAEFGIVDADKILAGLWEGHLDARIHAEARSVVVPRELAAGAIEDLDGGIDGGTGSARLDFKHQLLGCFRG